jgi:hypothetical protein
MNSPLKIISLFGVFWQDKTNAQIFRWNIFIIAAEFGLLFLKLNNLPPQLPLYYSLPWGESQLAPASAIFLLPILSLTILLINQFIATFLYVSHRLCSLLLITISLVCSFFSFISLWQIISLVS